MSRRNASDTTLPFHLIPEGSKLTPIPEETQIAKPPKQKKEIPIINYRIISEGVSRSSYVKDEAPSQELESFCEKNETTIPHVMAYSGRAKYFYDNIYQIDLSRQDRNGKTALDLAKERGREGVVHAIEQHLTQTLKKALDLHEDKKYTTLIAQGAPYSPDLVEKADITEQDPLKKAIAPHAIKRLNTNLSKLLSDMQEHGKAANQQERFEDIKKSARDIETSYNPLTEGLPYSGLSKHLGGIFRDAAKEAHVPLSARRSFTQWASDIAHGLGYKKKEREALKSSVGYKDIVEALKAQNPKSSSATITTGKAGTTKQVTMRGK